MLGVKVSSSTRILNHKLSITLPTHLQEAMNDEGNKVNFSSKVCVIFNATMPKCLMIIVIM